MGNGGDQHPPARFASVPDAALLALITRCRTAILPGERLALMIGADQVGYIAPALATALGDLVTIDGTTATIDPAAAHRLNPIAAALATQFGYRTRGEDFDVRHAPDSPVLTRLDRGALPAFGIIGQGVHLNGYVRRADGLHLWIARRSATKKLDPGKLDNIVGGGVSAGMTPFETLLKEAAEEAAMPATLTARATETARIAYDMERPEGLRRDILYCYDLELPDDFTPHAADGEVEAFLLMPATALPAIMTTGDAVKFNVNLVLIDFLLRHGVIGDATGALRRALAAN
ncbi:NUDIX domain-containing protein [Acidiphilium sp. PA]|uniref:NUDIX hydrolase n=1 Tax=Acidiphilium sp. PA TaxID=2871705 RepID=UPI0022440279|nr:NUDIX domain-containing protein [Acidiphilium sp. PA]MCW8307272.1 NUDIX domain-containing protein [Acidiphilium sp. PA]